ncbi:hypothetical protein F5890DRAFT_1557444 [Lentinula detonsa]|uniref:Uncharacterized protein n=1 Tax=Lentinula detonsa TaxID=2804962 RepID=A0AA38PS52_9AGAR|nr:hypothetical protein F5890DRAFT_1557444 [Lentinula detonsa]
MSLTSGYSDTGSISCTVATCTSFESPPFEVEMFWMLEAPSALSGGGGGGATTCTSIAQLLRAIAKQLLADAVFHAARPLHLLYSFRNPHGIRMATARDIPHFMQSLCLPIMGFSMLASMLDCALSAAVSPTWMPQENEMIYPRNSLTPGAPYFPKLSHFILILEVPLQFASVPCTRIAVETLLLPLALQIRVADMGQRSSEENTAESFYSKAHAIEASIAQELLPPSALLRSCTLVRSEDTVNNGIKVPLPPSANAQDLSNLAEIYTPPGSLVGPTVSAPEILCFSVPVSPPLPFPILPGGFCIFAATSLGLDLFPAIKSSEGCRRRLLWDGIRNHQSVCDILRQAGCCNLKNLKGGYELPSGKMIQYCSILQELGWGCQLFLHKLNSYNWCREFANTHCWDPALLPSKSAPVHLACIVKWKNDKALLQLFSVALTLPQSLSVTLTLPQSLSVALTLPQLFSAMAEKRRREGKRKEQHGKHQALVKYAAVELCTEAPSVHTAHKMLPALQYLQIAILTQAVTAAPLPQERPTPLSEHGKNEGV